MQDTTGTETRSHRSIRRPTRATSRPWTAAELRVRTQGEAALKSAKASAASGHREEAFAYCLDGLLATVGFTRPFAIRDEIGDFMRQVDPEGSIRKTFVIASLDAELEPLAEWQSKTTRIIEDIKRGG